MTLIVILLLGLGFLYFWFYIPYGDSSVKAGLLNNMQHQGYIFKTNEGRLIQTGIKTNVQGGIESNTFNFSVEDDALAKQLEGLVGKYVRLHYKQYYGTLPWRGYTKYIVDSIVAVEKNPEDNVNQIPLDALQ
ncbi:hypothetical protein D0T56_01910 [Dysgonomonas sp. 520]|nr:hypothetical protein [Dysgonomonas sp. 520]